MTQLTIQQAFEIALQHHQAGRLPDAEQIYHLILTQQPGHVDALHFLGVIADQVGRHDVAVALIRQAIALNPLYPEAHNNLGNALKNAGQLHEAIGAYRQALVLKPNYPEALSNLGNGLRDAGQLEEAIAAYRQAVAFSPSYAEAHNNLGNALRDIGQIDEGVGAYGRAIALRPDFPEAHCNLGNGLQNKGQMDEAVKAYHRAIVLKPNIPEAHFNLGHALRGIGKLDQAVAAYRQAITLKQDYPEAQCSLGNTLRDKGCLDEAIAAYRQAIVVKPDYPEAFSNLGNALTDTGQLDGAIAAYCEAIALKPHFPEAHNNLGVALKEAGYLDEAIAACRQAIALKPTYAEVHSSLGNALTGSGQLDEAITAYRKAVALAPDNAGIASNLVYTLHFHPACDAQTIAAEHRRWAVRHAEPLRKHIQPHLNDRSPSRRLRIGYISLDLREHPIGRFLLPLMAHHDKSQVEIMTYADVRVPDALTQRLRSCVDGWRNIMGTSDSEAAELIRHDRIDILVDLTMHMAHNRMLLFARKPAPVQATYLAYCSTTGLGTIDYRLSDPYLDPPQGNESFYAELTIRLPESYWCYHPNIAPREVSPSPAAALGYVTFGCLNNFCKVNELTLAAWSKILQAVPDSQLLLHAHEGSHRQRVKERLQREGIRPERVQFARLMPTEKYFDLYQRIDLALDTFPYGGGTTTCDALWMGVPVVSLAGKTAVGRGGLSILSNVGLPELVAGSQEEYVRIAIALADDLPRLTQLRFSLRDQMERSPLMDAPRFARNVEAAYRAMWRVWCTTAP